MSPCSKVTYVIGILLFLVIAAAYVRYTVWREKKESKTLCPKCKDGTMHPLQSLSVKMCNSCGHNEKWNANAP